MKPDYFKYQQKQEDYKYRRKPNNKKAIILYNNDNNTNKIDNIYNKHHSNDIDIIIVELKSNNISKNWSVIIKNKIEFLEGIQLGINYATHLSHSLSVYYDGFIIVDHNLLFSFDIKLCNNCIYGIEMNNCFYFNGEWLDSIRGFNPMLRKTNMIHELRQYCNPKHFTQQILDPQNKFGLYNTINKIAMVLVNYNMPERTDQIYESIVKYVKYDVDFYIVDNGSDLVAPSKYTTIWLRINMQTTNGWNMGICYANTIRNTLKFDYYGFWVWITTSSYNTEENDILTPMINYLDQHPKTMAICPSIKNGDSWGHLKKEGNIPKEVIFVDNLATVYRTKWFDSIRYFDPNEIRGFGVDIENGILTRYCGYKCVVDHRTTINKPSGIAYRMKRMNADSGKRGQIALKEMQTILKDRYGDYGSLYTKKVDISNGIFTNRKGTWFYDIDN